MKSCLKCKKLLTKENWYSSYAKKNYRICKVCEKNRQSEYYKNNKIKIKNKAKTYYTKNKEQIKIKVAKYNKKNKEKRKIWTKKDRKNNKNRVNYHNAKRRAAKARACPNWANIEQIKIVYRECQKWSKILKIRLEVDHVVPLISDKVCGLHVWENLQLLDRKINRKKGNIF